MLRKTLCFWINNTRKFFQEFSITLMPEKRLNIYIYIRPIAMGISLSVYFLRFLSEKWSTCKLIIYIIQLCSLTIMWTGFLFVRSCTQVCGNGCKRKETEVSIYIYKCMSLICIVVIVCHKISMQNIWTIFNKIYIPVKELQWK